MGIRIQDDSVVKLAYRLTDSEGRLIEDRTPESPFEYLHGRGQIVSALERRLEGKTAGYRAEITLSPQEAYGEYDPSLVVEMARSGFPASVELAVGMKFNTLGPAGKPLVVRITDVQDKTITVDGNHPLAGVELIFELRVLDVREATESEAETGEIGVGSATNMH